MIIKHLKNNLKTREPSPQYKKFRAEQKMQGNDLHHLIGSTLGSKKLNDYLLAEIPAQFHTVITYQRRATVDEQLSMLVDCIEGLIDYIEKLEAKK